MFPTSRSAQGEFVDGVLVGLGWGVDKLDDGDKGGVNITYAAPLTEGFSIDSRQ